MGEGDRAVRLPPVAGVILAGGQARRMGGLDKAGLVVGGRTILDRQIAALTPQVTGLALAVGTDSDRRPGGGLPRLVDPLGAAGPLAGLCAGLDWAAGQGSDWLLSVPCDVPDLPLDLCRRLALAATAGGGVRPAVAASDTRVHPVIGLWPVALKDDLDRLVCAEGERRAGAWAERSGAVPVVWPAEAFLNVNTPDDLARAETALAAAPAVAAAAFVVATGETAQDDLAAFVAARQAEGVRVGGVLQRGRKKQAVLVALDSGETLPIMQKLGQGSSCCAVDPQGMAAATAALRRALAARVDLLVVNKFGPLEAEGGGLRDEMIEAIAEGMAVLTTVTADRVPAWLAMTGGAGVLLGVDDDSARRWWGRRAPAA